MKQFERIGVFLNGSPADEAVLSYAGRIAKLADSRQVHAVFFGEEGTGEEPPPTQKTEFARRVAASLPAELASRTTCTVHEETGLGEVLATAKNEDLDLVVVGRRLPHSQMAIGSGFMKLARKAPCNVLVVPEQALPHFARILVPVDFGRHARMALEAAIALAHAAITGEPEVVCQHVYAVGYGHRSTGMTPEEAAQAMEAKAREAYRAFTEDLDTMGVPVEPVMTLSDKTAEVISDLAVARKMDLVLIGSRGRSRSAATLMGATVERILVFSALPVMVVKEKGETGRFLDVLLG
ncbi:MAG: universal stress protein [Phycisphaerales bacterium]|nr:MAG: universal stress protein [Phycisphaerales bacterium]